MTDSQSQLDLNFMQELGLAWKLVRDPEAPFLLKLFPIGAVLYFLFPEFFLAPPLGTPIDDAAVLFMAIKAMMTLTPPDLIAKHMGDDSVDTVVDGDYTVGEESTDAEVDIENDVFINPDRLK